MLEVFTIRIPTLGVLCACLVSGAWLGCDQEGNEIGSSQISLSISPDVFPEKYAEVVCDTLSRCCSPSEAVKTECSRKVVQSMAEEMASIQAGRTTFDANSAAACLTALISGFKDCVLSEEELKGVDTCDKTLVGTGKEGDSCEAGYQCLSDLHCFTSLTDGKGRCATFAQLGESCRNKECAPDKGLACLRATPTSPPPPPVPPGEPAGKGPGEGLTSQNTDPVCSKAAALGESCKSISCSDGLYCNRKTNPPTCASKQADGASCDSHDQCVSITCSKGTCIAEGNFCSMFGMDSAPMRLRGRSTRALNLGPHRETSK